MSQVRQTCFTCHPYRLRKQSLEGINVTFPEIGDTVVVRLLISRQHPKGYHLVGSTFDGAGRTNPRTVTIDEELRHHDGMIGRLATAHSPLVDSKDGGEVHMINDIADESGQVSLRQPILQVRR